MKIITFFRTIAIAEIALGCLLLLLSMTTSLHGAIYSGIYIILCGVFTWIFGLLFYMSVHYTELKRERFQKHKL